MNDEILYEVVTRLNGSIMPVGCSHTDSDRLENMARMCCLINRLTEDVLEIADNNRNSGEGSVKAIAQCADNNLIRVLNSLQ